MNKKGEIIIGLIGLILVILLTWFIIIPVVDSLIIDIKNYGEYVEFCEERLDFCYCDKLECSFRVQYTNNVPSKETREYCELAEELEDEEALFEGMCEQ